jgi:hypothetical protein
MRGTPSLPGVAEPTNQVCPVLNVRLSGERKALAFDASYAKLDAVLAEDFLLARVDVVDQPAQGVDASGPRCPELRVAGEYHRGVNDLRGQEVQQGGWGSGT